MKTKIDLDRLEKMLESTKGGNVFYTFPEGWAGSGILIEINTLKEMVTLLKERDELVQNKENLHKYIIEHHERAQLTVDRLPVEINSPETRQYCIEIIQEQFNVVLAKSQSLPNDFPSEKEMAKVYNETRLLAKTPQHILQQRDERMKSTAEIADEVINFIQQNISSATIRDYIQYTLEKDRASWPIYEWVQYSQRKPPINERVLVLVNGEIHEGFLESYVLMGNDEPTIFQTLYTNDCRKDFSAQHMSWGDDPYWMPIPAPKPTIAPDCEPQKEVFP